MHSGTSKTLLYCFLGTSVNTFSLLIIPGRNFVVFKGMATTS